MNDPFAPATPTDPFPLDTPPTPAVGGGGPLPAEPVAGGPSPAAPVRPPGPARRRRADVGMLLAASMLSAVLASGATAALWSHTTAQTTTSTPAAATATTTVTGVTAAASTSSSIASIAATDSPAVVTIETTVGGTSGSFRSANATGVGSGFIYDSNGYILTAAHVVEGASQITVKLADGRTFPGTTVASDPTLDVAVVKIAATGLPTMKIASASAIEIGQTVLAIGDPLGEYPGSVTVGVVSGLDRSITVQDDLTGRPRDLSGLIQTDASINPGNSGGPLVDASGAVIGIVSAGSSSAEGINFAVPISAAATVMATAKTA